MPHSSLLSFPFTILKSKPNSGLVFAITNQSFAILKDHYFDCILHSFTFPCLNLFKLFKFDFFYAMVELQSCASLVNAAALSAIEEETNCESVSVNAEIAAELQREKEKNAELMERISFLEAEIQKRDKESLQTNKQIICLDATERSFKKFKRRKLDTSSLRTDDSNVIKPDRECMVSKDGGLEDRMVNWMSMDDTQFLLLDKCKEPDIAADCDDTDETEDEDDHFEEDRLGSSVLTDTDLANTGDLGKHDKKETEGIGESKTPTDILISGWESAVSGSTALNKKPPKVPFCPKEVKRILESDLLLLKNAQSHTIRKIIVFASLGIRHGFEDMYELDFNHFSILRKGEPYVSPKDPGEHVLYENVGVRRKVFYPNRQNPTLCPVQILEEERAMRPSDPSSPSCLFLCIKYGGRTRNLPQNEYVRQRMGRNKLKSFGPVICRMAMLVHIRSGSFFFKALGITLLFMAGFPDDIVQRETKYKNLDLLQKYYRTDEDAKGEELFLSLPTECNNQASIVDSHQQLTTKTASTKARGKKQRKSQNSAPSSSTQTSQFGLMGYTSLQSTQLQTTLDPPAGISSSSGKIPSSNIPYHIQNPYHMFPPQAANTFMPMVYWPPPTAFPPGPYPGGFGYGSFPGGANCISIHPQRYYNHPSSVPVIPKVVGKDDVVLEDGDVDSDSSSSSTEPKESRD